MPVRSLSWLADISARELRWQSAWDEDTPPAMPVLPFVTQPLQPRLADWMRRIGVRRRVAAGVPLLPADRPVDHLVLLDKGISARVLGRYGKAIGLALPGCIACGNLSFFSGQPCFGHYFSVTPCEIIAAPQDLLRRLLALEEDLAWLLCTQFELNRQSDRLSFTMLSQLGAAERLRAFFLSWCVAFGRLEAGAEGDWIAAPAPLQRKFISRVIDASGAFVNTELAAWNKDPAWESSRKGIRARTSWFSACWEWIVRQEEPSRNARLPSFEEQARGFFARKSGP
ncbi:MAG: Crp/Fnr family transcriptional regulator [Duodenibacillus sp.]|nr:Crp/Fnr family transcriptional regulator [Duodenibacillus sp.]